MLARNLNSSTRDALGAQETIDFPHPESQQIIRKITAETEGNFKFVKDPFLRKHLQRMKATYFFWNHTICRGKKRMMSWREVIISNLKEGSSFAERISKTITYSYRWRTGVAFYNFPEEYIDEEAWGFDYFPSPFHLLPFRGECDDFKVTYSCPTLNLDLKDRFMEIGSKYVKTARYDVFFDDVDVISTLTAKATMVRPWKTEPNLTARAKLKYPGDITSYFEYKEEVIYKCPHEQRACWIPTIATNNSVKLAKKIVKETLHSPCDYYFRRPSWSDLREFLASGVETYFIMSDLKKSGLTFPHHLVLWVKELIDSKNIELDTSVFGGYVNSRVYKTDKKTIYEPNVGVGLGMADPLISWVISIIFLCWKPRWDEDYILHGMFWGDDQVIKVRPKIGSRLTAYKAAEIGRDWDIYQRQFGLMVHESKPFVGTTGCLLETYPEDVPGWDSLKRGQWIGSLFWALGAETIFQAKEYTNAVYCTLAEFGDMVELADQVINEVIIPFFGYEFFPGEVNYPFELGGWTSVIKQGLNQSLMMGINLPFEQGGLCRLQFLKRNKARGIRYEVSHEDVLLGKGGPYYQHMARSALYPDYFRPSFHREREVYRKLSAKRRKAYSMPGDPSQIYRYHIREVPGNTEIPDIFCIRFEAACDFIDLRGVPSLDEVESAGMDPIRCRIFVDEILEKRDLTTTLSYYVKSWPLAQIAALRSIIGKECTLSPGLFKFCEDDPKAYGKQLRNLLERGLTLHPQIKKEIGDYTLPFPVLGKGDTLGQDPYTGSYFLYDSQTIIISNWRENTCWSAICKRPIGNADLESIKILVDKEDEPIEEEEEPPPELTPEEYTATVDYIRWNIEGARRAILELDPPRDQAQEDQDAVYARYQIAGGGEDSDFDLDGGIDFDDLGVG